MTRYEDFGLFIDGRWQPSTDGASVSVMDPATEEALGSIPRAGANDLDRAIAAVATAAPIWRNTPAWTRSALMRHVAAGMQARTDEAAQAISRETGKPVPEAKGEWQAAVDQFDWYADEARRIYGHSLPGREPDVRLDVRYEPVGPVAAFTAWNFPALLPARKVAAALAAGCPIVIKPSEEAPSAMFLIAACCADAGLPDGVLNVVTGEPAEVSAHLLASPAIRKVSLTGSVPVGKLLMQQSAATMKKLSMELGGHAPVLVFPDVDAAAVGALCARTKFRNCGQVCISPSRFYVHADVYPAFSQAMAETARGLKLGAAADEGVEVGPMANARGRERAMELVEDAVSRGAELLSGGGVPKDRNCGFFFEPTVLGNVPQEARILVEEPFAPIAPIVQFTDPDEAIARANDVPFGLAAYVFSGELRTAHRTAHALEAGMVGVNDMMLATAEAPFGGIKESGFGREGGQLGIHEYLEPRYVKYRFQ